MTQKIQPGKKQPKNLLMLILVTNLGKVCPYLLLNVLTKSVFCLD